MKQVVLLWILCLPLLGMAAGRADSARLKKGDRCPEFVFQARDSSEVTLRQFRGKYVVIDVWASWCYPCKKEYPALRALAEKGCHNWNLVSPTPWLPQIAEAAGLLAGEGVRLPFVYNTSGYERVETLGAYAGLIDVALADLRYASAASAREGSDAPDYVPAARAAIPTRWRSRTCRAFSTLPSGAAFPRSCRSGPSANTRSHRLSTARTSPSASA